MRSDLTIGAAIQVASYMTALATDQPDLLTKTLGIVAGAALGALVAAVMSDQPTSEQRRRRFVAAFGCGVFLSVAALWIWPSKAGIDPREFIFLVSGASAFFGWRFVAKADGRADRIADQVIDKIEERAADAVDALRGGRTDREGGRVRPVVLVLLIGLAALAWFLRDVLVLIWLLLTEGVGH